MTNAGTPQTRGRGHLLRRAVLMIVALVVVGIVVDRAITSLTPRTWSYGTLTGRLEAVGPGSKSSTPLSGTVTATTTNRGVLTFSVGSSGRFTVQQVVVGTYTITARSPEFDADKGICHASGPVTVNKGMKSTVDITCQEQ